MNQRTNLSKANRKGVMLVLFAIVLPVLLLLAMIAINIAHMLWTTIDFEHQ